DHPIMSNIVIYIFLFDNTATTQIYTLSLHDALPISIVRGRVIQSQAAWDEEHQRIYTSTEIEILEAMHGATDAKRIVVRTLGGRSEEHTSELLSQSNLVCRLLLEKKKLLVLLDLLDHVQILLPRVLGFLHILRRARRLRRQPPGTSRHPTGDNPVLAQAADVSPVP